MHKNQIILIGIVLLAIGIIIAGGYKTLVGKATSTITPLPPCVRGDLTGDGNLDAEDLRLWLSLIDNPEPIVTCCVDLDNNGAITQNDYDLFFNALLEERSLGSCKE